MQTQEAGALAQQVIQIAADTVDIPADRISLDSEFQTDLGFDSLHLMDFIMAVEERFDVSVSDETAEKIKTVRQAVDAIERAIAGKGI